MNEQEKIELIKNILEKYSQFDESHHKTWCLDQIARIVYGDKYEEFINNYQYIDENGGKQKEIQYIWDKGIAP